MTWKYFFKNLAWINSSFEVPKKTDVFRNTETSGLDLTQLGLALNNHATTDML